MPTAKASQRPGEYEAFTGFNPARVEEEKKRIDFVFLGPVAEKRWSVVSYEVLTNIINGVY
jgi:hypothetical protein